MFVPASPVLHASLQRSKPAPGLDRWLPPGRVHYLPDARSAIGRALTELSIPRGATAFLPSYLCDSVVAPFREHGCALRFYGVDRSLRPDTGPIEDAMGVGGVGVVLVVDYFGFPAFGLAEIRAACDRGEAPLIEDCAHALFSRASGQPLGTTGDAAVFSFRKSVALPEGGVLTLRRDPGSGTIGAPPRWKLKEAPGLLREVAYWLEFKTGVSVRNLLLSVDGLRRRVYEMDGGHGAKGQEAMGRVSSFLADRLDAPAIIEARRRNFSYWLDNIGRMRLAPTPLFDSLPDGICPLGFPVLVERRDDVRRKLYRAGVALRTYWDVLPPEVDRRAFPDAAYLSDRILVLPVHQSLSQRHLDRVLEALERC